MRMRHILLVFGVVVAAWLAFFGDKTPTTDIAQPVARTSASSISKAASQTTPGSITTRPGKAEREPFILILRARQDLIGEIRAPAQTDGLFASQSWAPPPPPPPKLAPPPPPVAPPLPFTYLGKKLEAGSWEVFLARGDQTFIVHAQSVIEDTYQIDSIDPPMLSVTYLPLKQAQTLIIGGTD